MLNTKYPKDSKNANVLLKRNTSFSLLSTWKFRKGIIHILRQNLNFPFWIGLDTGLGLKLGTRACQFNKGKANL